MAGQPRFQRFGRAPRALLLAALAAALFVLVLAPLQAAAQGVEVPLTPEGEPICVSCHSDVSLDVVRTWRNQQHGRNKVGCNVCHNSHDQDFRPQPTIAVCQACHKVAEIHAEFTGDTPAARCMECHSANVHLPAGPESWFEGGLPPEKLEGEEEPESISAATAAATGVLVVVLAAVAGLGAGVLINRFVRNL